MGTGCQGGCVARRRLQQRPAMLLHLDPPAAPRQSSQMDPRRPGLPWRRQTCMQLPATAIQPGVLRLPRVVLRRTPPAEMARMLGPVTAYGCTTTTPTISAFSGGVSSCRWAPSCLGACCHWLPPPPLPRPFPPGSVLLSADLALHTNFVWYRAFGLLLCDMVLVPGAEKYGKGHAHGELARAG